MKEIRTGIYHSGTSGLVLPVPNKQAFPPEYKDKSRLTYYASLFNSIEINRSFYTVPMASTVKRWTEEVPDGFTFTYKLWRGITHVKDLAYKDEDVIRFMSAIGEAGQKKGCLLIQLPPSASIHLLEKTVRLLELVRSADASGNWKIALELRHASWYTPETFAMADATGCSIVLHDMPRSANGRLNAGAPFVYLRFHGPAGDYKGGYGVEHLRFRCRQIRAWRREGKDVFVYFNNTIGDAIKDLLELNRMVEQ
ncbi:DUF72 domain-containing protein [Chitinophaga deserti]|uniref:DUF72 domain-containing protein n=1 Tax=Chitinophaga deserti TaxID=2164099 RepID=UPI000D6C4893|nr:DUF72 domain-containing protein [Chitinophaga deserti]